MNAPNYICEARDLRVSYRRRTKQVHAVRGVDFRIETGSTFAIIGESGSGKSSIAKALCGLVPFDAAAARLFGESLVGRRRKQWRFFRKNCQMIFQDVGATLTPRMRVVDIVAEPMIIHGLGSSVERKRRVSELLNAAGLDDAIAKRYPHELSGGQRQRVLIARALAASPKLLIADEPTASLDVSVQIQILRLLSEMRRQFGLTTLYISHDIRSVGALADNVAVMHEGKFVETGPARAVLENPRHPYTRLLLSSLLKIN